MSKLFDLAAIQAIAADDIPAPHSLSPETRQLLLACFGLLHDTYNWHDYDEELTDSDIDTIDSLVSKAMDEIMTFPNLTNNSRMYWDGTQIRSAYSYYQALSTVIVQDSVGVPLWTSPAITGVNTANCNLRIIHMFTAVQTVAYDVFLIRWQYNYDDNSGVEKWENFVNGDIYFSLKTASSSELFSLINTFNPASVVNNWGYSGNHKVRVFCQRFNGSGQFTVLGGSRSNTLIIEEF